MARADHDKRRRFAEEFVLSGNATQAAIKAGVPAASAHSMGYKWLRHPDVLKLVRDEIDSQLRSLGPSAIRTIRELMESELTPPQTRLSAARDLLDRLGWVPPKRANLVDDPASRDVALLTREELEAIAAGAAGELVVRSHAIARHVETDE